MTQIQIILDVGMCLLWITTYTLVLIGTIMYRYPLISPITQVIIAPLEFSVLFLFIKLGAFRLDYASVAYLYWSIIEIIIISVMMKKEYIRKKYTIPYIGTLISITGIMVYWVTIKENMFFFNYFNTFIGIFFWLIFVLENKDYPMKSITLAIFIIKFIADVLAFVVYHGEGNWVANLLCILLPVVDSIFLLVYFRRKTEKIATESCI